MEDLRFYRYDFTLLHIEPNAKSVNWQMYYNAIGQFEAHFSLDSEVATFVPKEPYLVVVQAGQAAVITGWQAETSFAIFGRSLNWLFGKRMVMPFDSRTESAAVLAKEWVSEAFSDVDNFVCEDYMGENKEVTLSSKKYTPLSELIEDCLNRASLGHELLFDVKNKVWRWHITQGRKRLLTVSEDERNASDTKISSDVLDFCSCGWYQETKTDAEGETITEWKLVDAGTEQGIYRWETVLDAENEQEASEELLKSKKNTDATVKARDLFWHKDYELGDILTVKITKGGFEKTVHMRVDGVHLWYEEGMCGEQPIMEEVEDELRI